jgi:pilus assembly protein Flp/PilA
MLPAGNVGPRHGDSFKPADDRLRRELCWREDLTRRRAADPEPRNILPARITPSADSSLTLVKAKEPEMNTTLSRIRRFLVSEDGPTAVEYAVMLALIVVVCVTVIQSLGTSISGTFSSVQSSLGGSSS